MLKANHIAKTATGKNAGRSIKNQLHADQLDIGSAFVWNARIAMIAIDNIVLGHEKQLIVNECLGMLVLLMAI